MSDPVSNAEIEDVLSSIRRLVSEDTRPKPQKTEGEPDKLVLTPSLRIKDGLEKSVEAVAVSKLDDKAPILLTNATLAVAEEPEHNVQSDAPVDIRDDKDAVSETSDSAHSDQPALNLAEGSEAEKQSEALQPSAIQGFDRDPADFMMSQIAALAQDLKAPPNPENVGPEADDGDDRSLQSDLDQDADTAEVSLDAGDDDVTAGADESVDADLSADSDGIDLASVDLGQAIHDFVQDAERESAVAAPDELVEPVQDFQSKVAALETLVAQQTAEAAMDVVDAAIDDDADVVDGPDTSDDSFETPGEAQVLDWEDHRPDQSERPEANLSHEPAALTAEPDGAGGVEDPELAAQDAVGSSIDMDEAALRALVADIVRQELQGPLGERITRNVRKLVRREIHRVLMSQDFE